MPYAIFSKRTKIINRIVNDLTSLLPSESMLEVDDEINYPRGFKTIVEGQKGNTNGFPLFMTSDLTTTLNPQYVDYDAVTGRPYVGQNTPIYETPNDPSGNRKTVWKDLPIISHPFAWTVQDLAAVKYDSILARNYPFQVVIGEEFIDDRDIDTGSSSNIVLTEGKCYIGPGGELITNEFQLYVTSQGVVAPLTDVTGNNARQYVFDTYYLDLEPDPPQGVNIYWQIRSWATGSPTGDWDDAILNEQSPTTEAGEVAATLASGIILRIQNLTGSTFQLENYLMMLRVRHLPTI